MSKYDRATYTLQSSIGRKMGIAQLEKHLKNLLADDMHCLTVEDGEFVFNQFHWESYFAVAQAKTLDGAIAAFYANKAREVAIKTAKRRRGR